MEFRKTAARRSFCFHESRYVAHVRYWHLADIASCPHMSAFGGKADMTLCGNPLSRSLSGVKRTCLIAARMSAFDPKRTSCAALHQLTVLRRETPYLAIWPASTHPC